MDEELEPKTSIEIQIRQSLTTDTQIQNLTSGLHSDASDIRSSDSSHAVRKLGSKKYSQLLLPWLWELLTAVFSLSCLAATIIILLIMHNRALEVWKLPISPNALLAIFSTLSKSAVLLVLAECLGQLKWIYFQRRAHRLDEFGVFDEASRGPLGAVKFLFRLRWRAAASSIGCLLTLSTLAMEPFTQQILSYRVRSVPTPSSDSPMRITQSYLPPSYNWNILDTLYQSFYSQRTDYVCNDEECSWHNFTTLAICNTCTDVSTSLKKTCNERWHADRDAFGQICSYTYPSGRVLSARLETHQTFQTLFNATSYQPNDTDGRAWERMFPRIATVEMLWTKYLGNGHGKVNASAFYAPTAVQCDLSWCAKSNPTIHVVNGSLEGEDSSVEKGLRLTKWVSWYKDYPALGDYDNPFYPVFTPDEYPENGDISNKQFRSIAERLSQPQRNPDVFALNYYAGNNLASSMWSIFNPDQMGYINENQPLGGLVGYYDFVSDLPASAYKACAGDPANMMDKFVAALNHKMKLFSGTTIDAEIPRPEQFVHVDWPWLILPAATVILSAAFLVVSVLCSFQSNQAVWKSSALATLLHGLDDIRVDGFGDARSDSDPGGVTRSMWARLRSDEDGYMLLRRTDD